MEADKFGKVANTIDAVAVAIKSNVHINELVKSSNTILTAEFVMHMSREALSEPKRFAHMYEWDHVGDPNFRLWKHVLRGRGGVRQLTYDFVASKKTVPVKPELKEIGVKQNHIFVWKAPVLELGMPVTIAPKLAKALVFKYRGAIVFFRGTINIPRQGSNESWGSFGRAFNEWFTSPIPEAILKESLGKVAKETITNTFLSKMRTLVTGKTKIKTFTLTPAGIDKDFAKKLENSLRVNYIAGAATRRVVVSDDEI